MHRRSLAVPFEVSFIPLRRLSPRKDAIRREHPDGARIIFPEKEKFHRVRSRGDIVESVEPEDIEHFTAIRVNIENGNIPDRMNLVEKPSANHRNRLIVFRSMRQWVNPSIGKTRAHRKTPPHLMS